LFLLGFALAGAAASNGAVSRLNQFGVHFSRLYPLLHGAAEHTALHACLGANFILTFERMPILHFAIFLVTQVALSLA